MKKILLFVSILAMSCNSDDDNDTFYCTEEFVFGLNVNVKDAVSGAFLGEGVTVRAVDGSYSETLQLVETLPTFVGAGERAGNYVVTVSKDGYQTYVSSTVKVERDRCHVITETLEVVLRPE